MSDTTVKRMRLMNFLNKYGHYEKARLVRKAQELNMYEASEGIEDIYASMVRFAEHHNIILHKSIEIARDTNNSYFEEINEEGESQLKKIGSEEEAKSKDSLYDALIRERDLLSERMLTINKLISFYE